MSGKEQELIDKGYDRDLVYKLCDFTSEELEESINIAVGILTENVSVVDNPKCIYIGGQPGVGKSVLSDKLKKSSNSVELSMDACRSFHPHYQEIERVIKEFYDGKEISVDFHPGHKKVYRFYDKDSGYALGDVIALYDEVISTDGYILMDPIENWKVTELSNYEVKELQVPIYKKGKLVYNNPSLSEKQEYCSNQIKTLYPEVTRIVKPHGYYVDLSQELLDLKRNLIVESKKSK